MRTRPHPQKSRSGSPGGTRPHPLVGPGSPPHRRPSRPAAYPTRPRRRLVALAAGAPSRRTTLTPETKNATVVLVAGGLSAEQARTFARLLADAEAGRFDRRQAHGQLLDAGPGPAQAAVLIDDLLQRLATRHARGGS